MSSLGHARHHPGALSSTWDEPPEFTARTASRAVAGVLLVGLLALYVPTMLRLIDQVWSTAEQGHGPLILALCAWMAWQRRARLAALPDTPNRWLGGPLLLASLAAYVLGHSQGILGLEAASQIGVLAALLLCFKGWAGVRVMALPLAFMAFTVPLPGIFVQTITMPLKVAVSACAEWLLHLVGYPVGRMGVVLVIGQYQLLVADACAGLNSMFTLEALGFLWMSLRPRSTAARDALLALVILPISFAANVVRVMVLVLVTYHFGDAAGQGFAHDFSGIVLFVAAVLMMIVAESVIRQPAAGRGPSAGPLPRRPAVPSGEGLS
ncbi:exosortase B [Rhizobacter sp. J219]|uniref:exosortase B n=1 Tax=Rhizobacter sp. J219 TaxID=2898430 RepID=UPI0021517C62|nr:exosortase B [Rhizobacter sp. J219]MCR5886059.1 exosortase B [Rhizobacter sp. J219]